MTGAPGQTCSTWSHLLPATWNFSGTACWQISASRAVFPMPIGPDTRTAALAPC